MHGLAPPWPFGQASSLTTLEWNNTLALRMISIHCGRRTVMGAINIKGERIGPVIGGIEVRSSMFVQSLLYCI